jgi:hypothetical protein
MDGAPGGPIFIMGNHRSGTAWLHELLAETGCFAYVSAFHVIAYDTLDREPPDVAHLANTELRQARDAMLHHLAPASRFAKRRTDLARARSLEQGLLRMDVDGSTALSARALGPKWAGRARPSNTRRTRHVSHQRHGRSRQSPLPPDNRSPLRWIRPPPGLARHPVHCLAVSRPR